MNGNGECTTMLCSFDNMPEIMRPAAGTEGDGKYEVELAEEGDDIDVTAASAWRSCGIGSARD